MISVFPAKPYSPSEEYCAPIETGKVTGTSDAITEHLHRLCLGLNLTPEKLQMKEEEPKEKDQEHSTTTGETLPEGVAQKEVAKETVKQKWSGKHRLGLNLIYLNKTGGTSEFNEVTATLTYSYSF